MIFSTSDIRLFIWTANRPIYCQQALESLLAQQGELDIWVLDNSDNNETAEIIKLYHNVNYVKTDTNINFANFKKMQELMQKPYALTLCDDDLLHPNYLQLALKALNKYNDISFIGPKQNQFFTSEPPKDYYKRNTLSDKHWLIDNQADFALSFWDTPSPSWSGSIIKSQYYKNINPDRIKQLYGKLFDWPLLVEVMSKGKAISFWDKQCLFYRIHKNQDTVCNATGITIDQLSNWLQFFRQYALKNRGLYKIYFRRAVTNVLANWRVFTSKEERKKKTEAELLQFLKDKKLINKYMLLYYKMNQKTITKILSIPFKIYCKKNYYKKTLKSL